MLAGRPESDYHTPESEQSPVIKLPENDEGWVSLLQQKRQQYDEWLLDNYGRSHPIKRESTQRGYARIILDRVIESGSVNTFDISLELSEKHGDMFDLNNFERACLAVDAYTKDKPFLIKLLNH